MIDQIIDFNIMSPLLGDGYRSATKETLARARKQGELEESRPIRWCRRIFLRPAGSKRQGRAVVRGFVIDSETGALEKIQ